MKKSLVIEIKVLTTHHREADFTRDFVVVTVPIVDLRLTGWQVGADKAQRGALVQEAYGHAPFVTRCPAQSSFGRVCGNISTNTNTSEKWQENNKKLWYFKQSMILHIINDITELSLMHNWWHYWAFLDA